MAVRGGLSGVRKGDPGKGQGQPWSPGPPLTMGSRHRGNWGGMEVDWLGLMLALGTGTEEERQDLTTALGLVKELLSNVDQDVHELEKGARLQEIYHRMDPRAQAPVPGKGPFGREELLRRKLIHDGCLLWKTATGRFKGQQSVWRARREPSARCREGGASILWALSLQPDIWGPGAGKCSSLLQQSPNSVFHCMGHTGLPCQDESLRAQRATSLMRKTEKLQDQGTRVGQLAGLQSGLREDSQEGPGQGTEPAKDRQDGEERKEQRGPGRGAHFPGLSPQIALAMSFLPKARPRE